MILIAGLVTSLAAAASAAALGHPSGPPPSGPGSSCWDLKKFSTLVTFGDSYTDDSRFPYFYSTGGVPPPVGFDNPTNFAASTGGRTWVHYVEQYAGVEIHNYAVSGAVCSNDITPRPVTSPNGTFLFPAVKQYEVPAWIADSHYVEPDGTRFISGSAHDTVYAFWIGTNDLGAGCMLTDSQVKGTNLTSYVDCLFEQVKVVYDNGGRYFVLMNVAPLNLAPLYGLPEAGGVKTSPTAWPNKPANTTEISYRMLEEVVTVNALYHYRAAFATRISEELIGAKIAVYDVNSLFTDIYNNPSEYLNGTAPLNVTGQIRHCPDSTRQGCTYAESPDSYMWYDDLHPSEQTDRNLAKGFVDVVRGTSKWATYW